MPRISIRFMTLQSSQYRQQRLLPRIAEWVPSLECQSLMMGTARKIASELLCEDV